MKNIIFIGLLSFSTLAQSQSTCDKLSQLVNGPGGFKSKYTSNGICIGVTQGDSTYYFSFGKAMKGGPITENTIFEIASATKTFTGLLLGLEIEKKHIGQEDFIDKYLPKGVQLQPALRQKIKVTDLGSHQSGLPNFNDDSYIISMFQKDPEQPFRNATKEYLYKVLQETDSLVNRGSYSYSNYAFALLGQLLATRSHTTFWTLLLQSVIGPLQLTHTSLAAANPRMSIAGRYDDNGDPKPAMLISAMTPAGGLHSNATDMIKFLKAQIKPPLNSIGRAIKTSQQIFFQNSELAVGLGWEMQNGLVQKTGDSWGNSCILSFDPTRRTGVVVLSDHHNPQLVQEINSTIWKELK